MEWQTIAALIALGTFAIAISGYLSKREKKVSDTAERWGAMSAKLDAILGSVSGLRENVEKLDQKLDAFDVRLTKVEQSAKSMHHRLDRVEGKPTMEEHNYD